MAFVRNFNAAALGLVIGLPEEEAADLLKQDPDAGYIYKHLNNGSGICPKCAPWLNMLTTGDGTDGIPVPRVHPECKCYLMPLWLARLNDHLAGENAEREAALWQYHFEWLKSLPRTRLERIIGKVRTRLVLAGILSIEMLYNGRLLRPLHDLAYDQSGNDWEQLLTADMVLLQEFHAQNFDSLPEHLTGSGPGSDNGTRLMIRHALDSMRMGRGVQWPIWLVALVDLIKELVGANEA